MEQGLSIGGFLVFIVLLVFILIIFYLRKVYFTTSMLDFLRKKIIISKERRMVSGTLSPHQLSTRGLRNRICRGEIND